MQYKHFREELFIEIPPQPDILGGERSFADLHFDAETIVERLYEPLRAANPELISRRMIGLDTSGEHEMWMYDFHPKHSRATVYLQSGVHPIEVDSLFGLARMLTMITNGELDELSDVRFIVVPVVSVYGARERSKHEEFVGNYSIKHNVLGINSNRDCVDLKLAETRNILALIEEYRDVIDFGFDFHSTTETSWGDYMTCYPDALPSAGLVVETNAFLRERNVKGREPYVKYVGPASTYPLNHILGSLELNYPSQILKKFGIPMCTLEHTDLRFDDRLGTSVTMTLAVEQLANHIRQSIGFYIGE